VFVKLLEKLPHFHLDPEKRFRGLLRKITRDCWASKCRRDAVRVNAGHVVLDKVAAPEDADPWWEKEYRDHIVGRAMIPVQAEVESKTWLAFHAVAVEGRSPAKVAAELGMTSGAVHSAKHRVLHRLRKELEGMLD
jgi:RNA polymerase sigma-70 factor, ECF subfamily